MNREEVIADVEEMIKEFGKATEKIVKCIELLKWNAKAGVALINGQELDEAALASMLRYSVGMLQCSKSIAAVSQASLDRIFDSVKRVTPFIGKDIKELEDYIEILKESFNEKCLEVKK